MSVAIVAPAGSIEVYVAVWEQDSVSCYPSVFDRISHGTTFAEFLMTVGTLAQCGDDSLGSLVFQLSPGIDNWNSGFDQTFASENTVATNRLQTVTVGTAQVSLSFTVLSATVVALSP